MSFAPPKPKTDPYKGGYFTATWCEEQGEREAIRAAIDVLEGALERCKHQDMNTPEVRAALAWLRGRSGKTWPMDQFARALAMRCPEGRWQNANGALNGIRRQFGC